VIGSADIIYVDPPWPWNSRTNLDTKFGGGARAHYELLTLHDLAQLPVNALVAKRSLCFMWAVCSQIPAAITLLQAWGFDFVTVHTAWVKQCKRGDGLAKGPGYYSMNNTELLLLGRRGKPYVPWQRYPTALLAPAQEHSRKPEEAADRITGMYPDLYKVELFARRERRDPLWAVWGNEVVSEESIDALFNDWSKSVCCQL